MNDTLDAILEIDPATKDSPTLDLDLPTNSALVAPAANGTVVPVKADPVEPVTTHEEYDQDFEHSRQNIKELVELGKRAAEEALELAESGDSPRAYEVVGNLIGQIVAASKQLVDIHKVKKDTLKETDTTKVGTVNNIDKAVFVGRASDLLRELKAMKDKL
jgi:hypothetical protein